MNLNLSLTPEIIQLIKTIGIVLALVHFMIGCILIYQSNTMNKLVKTPHTAILQIIGLMYIGLLLLILFLIIVF